MFHRESGVFKTSYAADMALYPLPIAKWAVAAFAGLFIVIVPLTLGEYYVSILEPDPDRRRRRARPQHPGRLHRADLDRARRLHVGRRLHRRQPRRPPRRAVLGHDTGRRADGGADRRGRRHPVIAHQGDLSRDRDACRAADHRVDDQPRAGDLGRRAGLDPGAAPEPLRHPAQDPDPALSVPDGVRGAGDRRHLEPGAQPDRPRLHRGARPGHRRRDHRHQHLPLQARGRLRSRPFTPGSPACSIPIIWGSPITNSSS